jgi:hypothetical protein
MYIYGSQAYASQCECRDCELGHDGYLPLHSCILVTDYLAPVLNNVYK